jgi:hypothetical protein
MEIANYIIDHQNVDWPTVLLQAGVGFVIWVRLSHERLSKSELLPDKHLVDGGYIEASNLVESRHDSEASNYPQV